MDAFTVILWIAYGVFILILLVKIWDMCNDVKEILETVRTPKKDGPTVKQLLALGKDEAAADLILSLAAESMEQIIESRVVSNKGEALVCCGKELAGTIEWTQTMLAKTTTERALPARMATPEAFCEFYFA